MFFIIFAKLLGLGDEQLTWCIRGSVQRFGDFKEASQLERECGAARGVMGVGSGDRTSGGVPKNGSKVRSLTKSVSESNQKIG